MNKVDLEKRHVMFYKKYRASYNFKDPAETMRRKKERFDVCNITLQLDPCG